MADTAPLIFTPRLGGLFPASPAAEKAMADVKGNVRRLRAQLERLGNG